MRIATWNVNSVRTRLVRLLAWLEEHRPDVLCLQETKVVDDDFPVAELADAGWHAEIYGQRTYNGVALISREPGKDVEKGLSDADPQARFLSARFGALRVATAYFPNGKTVDSEKYAYKQEWLGWLREWLDARPDGELLALCGDYNIAADARDVSDEKKWEGSVLYNDAMRAAFAELRERGLVDAWRHLHEEGGKFSWWDYRRLAFPKNEGVRIDYVMLSEALTDGIREAYMDRDQRKKTICPEKTAPSDHVPVVVDVDVEAAG